MTNTELGCQVVQAGDGGHVSANHRAVDTVNLAAVARRIIGGTYVGELRVLTPRTSGRLLAWSPAHLSTAN
jgi:hypothetical protein